MDITVNFIKDCLISQVFENVLKIEDMGIYLAISFLDKPFGTVVVTRTQKIDKSFIQGVTIEGAF